MLRRGYVGVLLVWLSGCVGSQSKFDKGEISFGVLLSYTGKSAVGSELERAIVLALEDLDAAGAGVDFGLRYADTASDPFRGEEATRTLLDEGVVAIIGPEDDDIAKRSVEMLASNHVVGVSGGATSPAFRTLADDGYWFRTIGSSRGPARALAERIAGDEMTSVVVFYDATESGTGFEVPLRPALTQRGVEVRDLVGSQPGETDMSEYARRLAVHEADAVVLITSPLTGALFIQDWVTLGGTQKAWYLAPTLRSDTLIRNSPPGLLEGAVGVAYALPGDSYLFSEHYAARWGAPPVDADFYYYDAAILLGLSVVAARESGAEVIDGPSIRSQLTGISREGTTVTREQLADAIALIHQGQDIDYQGVSGDVDFDDDGEIRSVGNVYWTIRRDQITDL